MSDNNTTPPNSKLTNLCWTKPTLFNLGDPEQKQKFQEMVNSGTIGRLIDPIEFAFEELYDIEHPELKDSKSKKDVQEFKYNLTNDKPEEYGLWVFYPWTGSVVHFPPKKEYRILRTARNRNLIRAEEQEKLFEATVLVAGLSVGSNVVEALVSQGVGGTLILADMDIIEPTNLNRIKVPYAEVGLSKIDAIAKWVSEIDPYIDQIHLHDGITQESLNQVFDREAIHSTPDVLIDEIDDLSVKLMMRQAAKKHHKPILMATDDGENAILDIERHDLGQEAEFFGGRIPEVLLEKILGGELGRAETGMIIGKYFVGLDNIPLRMFESLVEVGKSLPSWPQLAGAATLSGVVCSYATRRILLGQELSSGRHIFDLDAQVNPDVLSAEYQKNIQSYKDMLSSNGGNSVTQSGGQQ